MKKILTMLFIIMISFVGMMGIKAATWSNPKIDGNNCSGETFEYKCGATAEECSQNAENQGIDGDAGDWAEPCSSGNGYCISVQDTCRYTLKNDNTGEDVQVFCLEGHVKIADCDDVNNCTNNESYKYKEEENGTLQNKGLACGLFSIYESYGNKLFENQKYDKNSVLTEEANFKNVSDDKIWDLQQKIWSWYEFKSCDKYNKSFVEYEKNKNLKISLSEFKYVPDKNWYVSYITISGQDLYMDEPAILKTNKGYLWNKAAETDLTNENKNLALKFDEIKLDSENYNNKMIIIPAEDVTPDMTVTLTLEAYSYSEVKLNAYFTKLTYDASGSNNNDDYSQAFGIPRLTRTSTKKNQTVSASISLNQKSIKISKKDITNEKELPGAEICVYKYNDTKKDKGDKVECFKSTDKPYEFHIASGKYILEETATPEGYEKIMTGFVFDIDNDMNITLEDTKSDNIKVKDDTIILYNVPTKVKVEPTGKMAKVILWVIGISLVCVGAAFICTKYLNKKKEA